MTSPRRTRLGVALAALTLLLAACGGGGGDDDGVGAPEPTTGPPAFTAASLTGGEVDSSTFSGEPKVLWFWAPWCTTCRAEAPGVVAAAAEVGEGVELIGVAGRGEVPAMEEFVDQTGTDGFTHVVDDDGSIWADYGVAAQPAFAFISADGEVETVAGAIPEDELVDKMQALQA